MANRWGNNRNSKILFWGVLKSLQMVTVAMNEKTRLLFGRKAMTNLENILKQRHYFADKCPYSQSYGFASSHVWMWVWVNYESWWWSGRPGVLQFMGLQRVGYDWATELNWTELHFISTPPSTLEISQPALCSGSLSFMLTSPFHWPMAGTDSSYKTKPVKV